MTRRNGIRVNALAPGYFESEMTDELPAGYLDGIQLRQFVDRLGDPQELATALVFVCSAARGYVSGQTLVVDGGLSIA